MHMTVSAPKGKQTVSVEILPETNSGSSNFTENLQKGQLLFTAFLMKGFVMVTWSSIMYLPEATGCIATVTLSGLKNEGQM